VSLGIDKVAGKAVLTGPWEAGYLKRFVASGADLSQAVAINA
jgi:hypothetical protein